MALFGQTVPTLLTRPCVYPRYATAYMPQPHNRFTALSRPFLRHVLAYMTQSCVKFINGGHSLRTERDVIGRWAWPRDGGKSPVNVLQVSENASPVGIRRRQHVIDVHHRSDVRSPPETFTITTSTCKHRLASQPTYWGAVIAPTAPPSFKSHKNY